MSEIKVNSIKGVGASAAAITVNNSDGTCTANLTNRTNKNLILNGAFLISQRGTSSTSAGYQTVDRFKVGLGGNDEAPTIAQADVASGTTPYTLGFRKAFKFTNGNQTGGAGAADTIEVHTRLEGQDIANSGWNYKSTSSFVTLSFWIKSSVAQSFPVYLHTQSNPEYVFPFETGSLSADTWTKITKTISGNSNLVFDNDNGHGLKVAFVPFRGTDYTDNSVTYDAWAAYASGSRSKDMTSTWYTTNDATFEITGVQLEVGDSATDFELLSFAQELALCQRYCIRHTLVSGAATAYNAYSDGYRWWVAFPSQMRDTPTMTSSGGSDGGSNASFNIVYVSKEGYTARIESTTTSSQVVWWYGATVLASAEL